jgi:LemA protein
MKNTVLSIVAVVVIAVISLVGISGLTVIGTYNGFTSKYQTVESSWSQVENNYQRRYDLIPNLVEIVKGTAHFEKSTFTEVAEARANAGKINIDLKNVTPEQLASFQQAQQGLGGALSRLLVVSEQYPFLNADKSFLNLQGELAGTENRIAVSRRDFNLAVQGYNTSLNSFPGNFIGQFFGFQVKPYFKAEETAAVAPKIKF